MVRCIPRLQLVVHSGCRRLFGPLENPKPWPDDLAPRVVETTSMDEPQRSHAVQDGVDRHADALGACVVLDDQGDSFAPYVPLVCRETELGLSDLAVVERLGLALEAVTHVSPGRSHGTTPAPASDAGPRSDDVRGRCMYSGCTYAGCTYGVHDAHCP
jgi:hypothetical protein